MRCSARQIIAWLPRFNFLLASLIKGVPKKTGQKCKMDFEHEGLVQGDCPFHSLVYS